MIYLLFLLLVGLSYHFYKEDQCHFNSPVFIVSAMLTICTGVYCVYIDLMGNDISIWTVLVIVFGLLSWSLGQSIAKGTSYRGENIDDVQVRIYDIPRKVIFVCSVIVLVTVYFSYQYFMEVGFAYGGGDIFSAYGAARVYMLEVQSGNLSAIIPKSKYLTLFEMLGSSVAFFFIYASLYNMVIHKRKDFYILIPAICYLPIMFFATSRMIFFALIAMFFAISSTLIYARFNPKQANRRIVKFCAPLLIVGLLLFRIGGDMRGGLLTSEGRKGESSTVSESLCMYVASNIYALDYFLLHNPDFKFGDKTLGGFRQILGRFGVEFKARPRHFNSVKYKTGAANVYTGFKEDITDYSVLYWVYLVLIGYVCGYFYYSAKRKCNTPHAVYFVVLGKLYYCIFIYFYTDDFYQMTSVDFWIPFFLLLMFNNYIKKKYIKSIYI